MQPISAPFELPHVGVVITCYNYRAYVEDAIRSVLGQTYRNWTCVIIDDASTDGSAEHVRQLLETIGDPRLSVRVRPQNGGQLASFRDGFAAGNEPFVAFLDADDVWLPNFLAAHLSAHLNTMRSASLSSSDLLLVDANRAVLAGTYAGFGKPRSGHQHGVIVPSGGLVGEMAADVAGPSTYPVTYFGPEAYGWMWAPTSSMVFRRGALEPVLAFPFRSFSTSTDYLAATCAHMAAGSLLLSECLGLYRLHGANISTNGPYAGGYIQQTPTHAARQINLGADVLDYVLANAGRLDSINGRGFVSAILAHHIRRFGPLIHDPRIAPFLDRRNLWRQQRKRISRGLRRLLGGAAD